MDAALLYSFVSPLCGPARKSKQAKFPVSNRNTPAPGYFFAAFIGSLTAGNVWNSTL